MDYVIDLKKIEDLEELHGMLSDLFEFPKYYGKNLDGFYDVMSSRNDEMHIIVKNSEKEDEKLNSYVSRLKGVLKDLEHECENVIVTFES